MYCIEQRRHWTMAKLDFRNRSSASPESQTGHRRWIRAEAAGVPIIGLSSIPQSYKTVRRANQNQRTYNQFLSSRVNILNRLRSFLGRNPLPVNLQRGALGEAA